MSQATTVVGNRLDALCDNVLSDVVAWRRHLHAHPELSFEEHQTAQFIVDRLADAESIEITRPSGTSVVGELRGGSPGPTVAIRADFDALPILEETGLSFASTTPGVMHACGHDGHTSILLGAATVLSKLRTELPGTVRFLFENGEEALPGGAAGMVQAGVMTGVDRVIGLHLWAREPIGDITVRAGRLMAACDVFRIEVHGRGGHIGSPHAAVDPIAIGAQIVANLQHIVAREVDPLEPAVVGVTEFHAGHAVGIIPESAAISGGTNVFSVEVQDLLERRIGQIATGVCAAHGATCQYEYTRGYRAVINDPDTTAIVARVASRLFGEESVVVGQPTMAGEDFSAFQAAAPSCFVLVGAANASKGITFDHHHPRFDVDEAAFATALRLFVHSAVELLRKSA